MDGTTLRSGSVACVSGVKNPVTLARRVMDQTPHCLLVGDGANRFAVEQGVPIVPSEQLVTEAAHQEYLRYKQQYEGNLFPAKYWVPHSHTHSEQAPSRICSTTQVVTTPLAPLPLM